MPADENREPHATGGAGLDRAFWEGKRVFLTGHTGFKGSWLALWLQSLGSEVVGYSLGVPTQPSLFEVARIGKDIESIPGDVRDGARLVAATARSRPDVVFHLAAQPIVRRGFAEPVETYETNVMGTVNLLEAVRRVGDVPVVVIVTSDKCYENREWEWGYREDEPKGGFDPYSSSKACAELVTDAYRRSYFTGPGDPGRAAVASARAGNVIGGGDWSAERLIPDVMKSALRGEAVKIRNPHAIRPWQHALEPLSGYLALAAALWQRPDCAVGYNFGPDERDVRPVHWIVDRIAELWGEDLRWELDGTPGPHEARYLKLDSSRARVRLSWEPRWGLEEGLARTVAWFRAYRDGADLRDFSLAQIRAYESAGTGAARAPA